MKKIILLLSVLVIMACEIPVAPVQVEVIEIDYIELNWLASIYQLNWTDEGCLSGADDLMFLTGQDPTCDSYTPEGAEYGLLRMHSIEYEADNLIYALVDYTYLDQPGVIRTKRIDLRYTVYNEK
jgi:hypothetical protein